MLYHLFKYFDNVHNLPGAGMFQYISFRAAAAIIIALLIVIVFGRNIINFLRRKQIGEEIRDLGLEGQLQKKGTPTMGGVIILLAILIPVLLFGQLDNVYIQLMLVSTIWLGLIGFLDDYEKLRHKQNLGLSAKMKFLLQLLAATCFLLLLRFTGYLSPNLYIPFWNTYVPVSEPLYFIFAAFVIVGTVNAVNITDGVDGLAAGTCVPVFLCFTAIVFCWGKEYMPQGIFASGMVGALLGFLIYNFNPARVFMGDTGSLFLGGCISGLAFALDVPLLLIPLCIMPIIETLSDIIQVAYFKLSRGKRVFKMAPFHHHLEMGGWTGRKWKEKEIFVLFAGITLVMAVVSLLGVTGRYSF